MGDVTLLGVFSVKVPVSDLARSRQWYERVLGYRVELEFRDDDGVVRGTGGHLRGVPGTFLALRENPRAAEGIRGSDLCSLAVADRAAIDAWAAHLDGLDVPHGPVVDATVGWMLPFHDPDGIELHLYSVERHGIDQSGRVGYGDAVDASTATR